MATNKPDAERRKAGEAYEQRQHGDDEAPKSGARPDAGRGPEEKRVAAQDGVDAESRTLADRGTESWERKSEPGSKR